MNPEVYPGTEQEVSRAERMCTGKTFYPDKKAAVTALNHQKKNRGRHGRPDGLRAYPCPYCRGWHLTKAEHGGSKR